jgi:hypothetical protein
MNLSETAVRALNAYGGAALWQEHRRIEAEVSVQGLAFRLKGRPFFDRVQVAMDIHRPLSSITPIGKNPEYSGVLEGGDVRILDRDGQIITSRTDARRYFPLGRRLWYWDDADMAYFANYALWNYFTLPALLMHPDIRWTEKAAGMLQAIFPEHIPTHSREQTFIFDTRDGRLLQHNYTAAIISRFARAANVVQAHAEFGQGSFPALRKVTPQSGRGRPLKGPTLIAIEVHSFLLC